jgi:hypothetical protein
MSRIIQPFNDVVFKQRVSKALEDVDRILELDRNPRLAEDVSHDYTDKYALANTLTSTAIIAEVNVLDRLGLTNEILQKIDKTKATTLRFQAFDSCQFVKEQVVDVPVPTTFQTTEETTTTSPFVGLTNKSNVTTIVNRVKEFHWKVDVKWEISVYSGTNFDKRLILEARFASTTLIVQSTDQTSPLPGHREHKPIEMSLTWLLQQLDLQNNTVHFTIDTQDRDTKTPRRNKQVEDALSFYADIQKWSSDVRQHFVGRYQSDIIRKHNPAIPTPCSSIVGNSQDLSTLDANIFVPIIPLMEETGLTDGKELNESTMQPTSQSALTFPSATDDFKALTLSTKDATLLLNEQVRTLDKTLQSLKTGYPDSQSSNLISVSEGKICVLCSLSSNLVLAYGESLQYIERLLEAQLVAAIGKQVTSADLDQYVRHHNAKMLSPAPKAFCHSIRRPNHNPEGVLSIECAKAIGEKVEPIETHVREVAGDSSLKFPLNAATTVELTGSTYLHGWLNHRFRSANPAFQLIGRARQFSSFVLVFGTMIGPDRIQPKDAIILQNKDDITIPLLLSEIPTSREFKDAIESLSPEQQRFAKAYRLMQLESSVLGVCVIQIKPHLEDLLGLPHDSLTKEMQLTQDLMELFVEYQVPSDMLSYDGENEDATAKWKVDNVREHVKAVMDVIQENKKKQLKEQEMRTDMATETAWENRASLFSGSQPCVMSNAFFSGSAGPQRSIPFGAPAHLTASLLRVDPFPTVCRSVPTVAFAAQPCMAPDAGPVGHLTVSMEMTEDASHFPDFPDAQPLVRRSGEVTSSNPSTLDFTSIPKLIDTAIEKYDADSALRSTTIKTGHHWMRDRQTNLLTKPMVHTLNADAIKLEKNMAFDLLDALSRSGSLPLPYSELHVIVCVTHCFEKSVMETVIQDNVNPIEKLEWSTLLLASIVHGVPANTLISNIDRTRLEASFPAMMQSKDDEGQASQNMC